VIASSEFHGLSVLFIKTENLALLWTVGE